MHNLHMRSKESKRVKLRQYMASTTKILSKARDLYVKSMSSLDDKMVGGYGSGGPIMRINRVPDKFAPSSSVEHTGIYSQDESNGPRLCRTTSEINVGGRRGLNEHDQPTAGAVPSGVIRRSYTVGLGRIGRIDEEESCDFGEDNVNTKTEVVLYPRSKSGVRKLFGF